MIDQRRKVVLEAKVQFLYILKSAIIGLDYCAPSVQPKRTDWFWPVQMERFKERAYIFPATTLQIPVLWPTGAVELSGSDP